MSAKCLLKCLLRNKKQIQGIPYFRLVYYCTMNHSKALNMTHLVSPKSSLPSANNQLECHLQLVQDMLLSYSNSRPPHEQQDKHEPRHFIPPHHSFHDDADDADSLCRLSRLHRQGSPIHVSILPCAISLCAFRRNLPFGTQLHSLAITLGFSTDLYVATSFVTMYSKCALLPSASMVFHEMTVRNVVSWTALISAFAQTSQVHVCFHLFTRMTRSALKPNDFTLTALLSACVAHSSLGPGKTAHCLAILSGFHSYLHVANALVSMYSKCGDLSDAFSVFQPMPRKDLVSWNSMIAGYALHGLASKAIALFQEMTKLNIKPDSITFLGLLSSCRHAGLLKQGHAFFNSMLMHGVEPDLGHYSCMVDLLGRAGLVEEGRRFILEMPIKPNSVIWGSLLSSCRLHNNVWIGIEAAENRLALEPSCAATHLLLAKLYARVGMWNQVAKVWKMMKDIQIKTNPGYSWISIGNEVFSFRVDDTTNSKMNEVLSVLEGLKDHMTSVYVSESHEKFGACSCSIVS